MLTPTGNIFRITADSHSCEGVAFNIRYAIRFGRPQVGHFKVHDFTSVVEGSSMMSATDLLVVFVTVGDLESGRDLAGHVVREKLAACVNLVPHVESIYMWEGRLHQDPEVLLVIKTTTAAYPELEAAVKSRHSYTTPEILAVSASRVSRAYAEWVGGEVRGAPEQPIQPAS